MIPLATKKPLFLKTQYFLNFQFFQSIHADVEGYVKFLCGILRCHDTDVFLFELAVEKCVWDIIKFDFEKYANR